MIISTVNSQTFGKFIREKLAENPDYPLPDFINVFKQKSLSVTKGG